jgi:hypothetical protein|tara:strand:+ start:8443 stop:9207 length:765 start_codon:yes stop_codon:yes gene_type:complete
MKFDEIILLGCSHSDGTKIDSRSLYEKGKEYNLRLPNYDHWTKYVEEYLFKMYKLEKSLWSNKYGNLISDFHKKFVEPISKVERDYADIYKSNQNWASILSDKLGVGIKNYALPGHGSFNTLNEFFINYEGGYKNKLVLWAFTYPTRDNFHPFIFNYMGFKDNVHFLKTIYINFAKSVEEQGGIFRCFFIDSMDPFDDNCMNKIYKDLSKYFLFKSPKPLFNQLPLSIQVKRYDGVHLDISVQEDIAEYLYEFF